MKRGEAWWVSFDPSLGGEICKTRPAVIVSNDAANRYLNRVAVLPCSSNTKKIYPSEAAITLKGKSSKIMADQIRTVNKLRLQSFIANITPDEMTAIERAIKLQLALT